MQLKRPHAMGKTTSFLNSVMGLFVGDSAPITNQPSITRRMKRALNIRPRNVSMLQAERLRVKNQRRAINGLPPKHCYADI